VFCVVCFVVGICLQVFVCVHNNVCVCFVVYSESTAVTEKCVVVYRTAWI
jgi:hypothetical protein